MTSKIRILSDNAINKIAAGEVIENPASVVKELVENSLDAGSTEICIEIKGGGRQLIRVSDNGSGMGPDDALLCLERHATSKIRNVEEIYQIETMGFRGEAIPSIASISKFSILTRSAEETDLGTLVIVDGGKLVSCSPAACSAGTVMEVKSLFFNLPVRKKFLKSPNFDANEILKTVSIIALGYPNVAFRLINDGKASLTTYPSQAPSFQEQLRARVHDMIGEDYLNHTYPVSEEINSGCHFKMEGVIGKPSYTRHNRSGQYLFINNRPVSCLTIAYAVKEAYAMNIASGRHPVFVLHLTIPPNMLDVNVHPQKKEVRLRQDFLVREQVMSTVSKTLQRHPFQRETPSFSSFTQKSAAVEPWMVDDVSEDKNEERSIYVSDIAARDLSPLPWNSSESSSGSTSESSSAKTWRDRTQMNLSIRNNFDQTFSGSCVNEPHFLAKHDSAPQLIATIPGYLILETPGPDKLILIDQRGAHARILYEKLMQQDNKQSLALQSLLTPHHLELTPFDANALRNILPLFHKLGIDIQECKPGYFLIDAVAQIFEKTNIKSFVMDVVHQALEEGSSEEQIFNEKRAKQLALEASKIAMSSHHRLSQSEAQGLTDQLFACQHPNFCPSGKKIMAILTAEDLAGLFLP